VIGTVKFVVLQCAALNMSHEPLRVTLTGASFVSHWLHSNPLHCTAVHACVRLACVMGVQTVLLQFCKVTVCDTLLQYASDTGAGTFTEL
jgi:hypothetical protein